MTLKKRDSTVSYVRPPADARICIYFASDVLRQSVGALDQFHQRTCSYEAFDQVDPKDS